MSAPRIGFVGTGWIGRHRMEAMIATGAIEAAWICEPDAECAAQALAAAPGARLVPSFEALLAERPDGVVIATPSALHAAQSIRALEAGAHVFCQKPLGRDCGEVDAVLAAAGRAGRSISVDFSYRHTAAFRAVQELVEQGALGRIYAVEAVFHNGYGPGKPWFHDPALAGGGCLIDLGVHLVDMIGLLTGNRPLLDVTAQLLRDGERPMPGTVENYAAARLAFEDGVIGDVRCSWNAHVGSDCEIRVRVHGTEGGAEIANIGGSFFDLAAWHDRGTARSQIAAPPDDWGGRAAAAWAEGLAGIETDPTIRFSAEICDAIYRAGGLMTPRGEAQAVAAERHAPRPEMLA